MTQALETTAQTLEAYFEQETNSQQRHEYIKGEIISMAGGTPNHNRILLNFGAALNVAFKRQPYEVFVCDQRLWIPEAGICTYPDVMIVAPPLGYGQNRRDTLTNPLFIAEVLSKSTANYDQTEKFSAYRTIDSLQEYVMLDQTKMHVEQYTKVEPRQWIFREYDGDAILSLASVPFEIALADLYDKVDFAAEE
ncbi:MAG: Uma2 family endonuclease [Chloroflexaceae bacterium]|nr:Uma2 family endonuclease [Chloroflexaceae bacterium]